MSTSKILVFSIVAVVGLILFFNWPTKKTLNSPVQQQSVVEIEKINDLVEESLETKNSETLPRQVIQEALSEVEQESLAIKSISEDKDLPQDVDRVASLFQPYPPLLPFIETLSYSSKVEWLTGRSAYLGDYASQYQTSKHFISRSLHGMGNYLSDVVSKGDRFNVYRRDKQIEFHLVLDLSRLKLWLYCYDKDEDTKILLKTYCVSAGKLNSHCRSGSLTPLGTFAIGNECAVYGEGVKGNFKSEMQDLISTYGVRWISIGREIAACTGSSKGLGIHGVPWKRSSETEELVECRECIGKYESEGCIRLLTEDVEELYAIIVSKPAFIHIVKDFIEANVPGTCLLIN